MFSTKPVIFHRDITFKPAIRTIKNAVKAARDGQSLNFAVFLFIYLFSDAICGFFFFGAFFFFVCVCKTTRTGELANRTELFVGKRELSAALASDTGEPKRAFGGRFEKIEPCV